MELELENSRLKGQSPEAIVKWALDQAERPLISTNFRPLEAVLLHLVVQQRPDIPVLWVDTSYNTPATYRFAEQVIGELNLKVDLYIPRRSRAHRDTLNAGIPGIDNEALHREFTEEVKLEPFRRAFGELQPDVWFTALRRVQNPQRETLQVLGKTPDGVLKVSPVLAFSDGDMKAYLKQHGLPDEEDYFDPTKVLEKRECGLHLDSAQL